jgi:two-component system NarL family sensor kinase
MQLKQKIIVLSVLPLLAVVGAMGGIIMFQANRLAEQQVAVLEENFLAARRAELKHYIALALTSIDHLYGAGRDDEAAKAEAKAILTSMNFGDDGYFYAYDLKGVNLVHPRKHDFVGKEKWDLRDPNGLPVIQELIARANEGGGYQRYLWEKPSTGKITQKLGYAVKLDRWGWMLGTGLYLDDFEQAVHQIRADVTANIKSTMLGLTVVAIISAIVVFTGGLVLNVSEHRLADKKLKDLAQRIVTSQEEERARVSRELHDGISQLLVSIKYQFELVELRLASGGADQIKTMQKELGALASAIAEVRRISHALRPSLLDNLGLPAALDQSAKEFSQRTGILVSVDTNVPAAGKGRRSLNVLSEQEAVTLFRIAQEALNNVERHAEAHNVQITLENDGKAIRLSIVDDGHGFEVHGIDRARNRGIGLRNIRERIEHHGGTLTLSSVPGRTEIVAMLPLTQMKAAA